VERQLNITQCNDIEKVLYASGQLQEAAQTWRESYPQLVVYALLNLEDEILLRGVEFVTPKNLILINRN